MKKNFVFAPAAAIALLLGTTALHAQSTDTRSVSASVSGALQGDTGFLTGGQVQVTGVGQGGVTLNRSNAAVSVIAGSTAQSPNDPIAVSGGTGLEYSGVPTSSSSMITTFDFNRQVNTSGALVGIGTLVAQGESLGGVGVVGSANANATRAGTDTVDSAPVSGSASTPTSAQGSLVGNFSTANNLQMVGTGSLFAGSQALNLGERNVGASVGETGSVTANSTGIALDGLTFTSPAAAPSVAAFGEGAGYAFAANKGGAGFFTDSQIRSGTTATPSSEIALNVANAGNGTVNVNASTGGFFGQGTTFGATAAPTFSNTGFFRNFTVAAPST
jgi:hypothetical protein